MSIRYVVFDLGGVVFVYRPETPTFAERDVAVEARRRSDHAAVGREREHPELAEARGGHPRAEQPDSLFAHRRSKMSTVVARIGEPVLLDAQPGDVLYVDDTRAYVGAARAFGFWSVLFDGPAGLEACLEEAGLLRSSR